MDTYPVTAAAGPTILRIYPAQRRTETDILAELDVLAYLQAAGISVSAPILQRDDQRLMTIQAPEGVRYAALFTYALGNALLSDRLVNNVLTFSKQVIERERL